CVGRPHSRYYARSALTFITDTAHYMLYTLYLHAAEPHVELLRKVGRLVAEEEAAHCVLLVEEVARPKLDADPAEVAADLEVHERVVVRLLVVRIVEVEGVAAGELEPPEPAGIVPVLRADRVAPARRMRLLPALERRIHGELDDLR